MTESNSKYKMFSNYMHNELGITKEDIRSWCEQAVFQKIDKLTGQVNIEKLINFRIEQIMNRTGYAQAIVDKVAKELATQLKIEAVKS